MRTTFRKYSKHWLVHAIIVAIAIVIGLIVAFIARPTRVEGAPLPGLAGPTPLELQASPPVSI